MGWSKSLSKPPFTLMVQHGPPGAWSVVVEDEVGIRHWPRLYARTSHDAAKRVLDTYVIVRERELAAAKESAL